MSLKKSKSADGRVNSENVSGSKVPRKGFTDQTGGKLLGTRDIRNVNGPHFNFVRSGG